MRLHHPSLIGHAFLAVAADTGVRHQCYPGMRFGLGCLGWCGLESLGSAAGRAVVGAGSEAMYSVSRLLMRIRRHGRAEPDTATVDVLGARYQQGQGEGAS